MFGKKEFCIVKFKITQKTKSTIVLRDGFKSDPEVIDEYRKKVYHLKEGIYNIKFEAEGFCSQEMIIVISKENLGKKRIIEIRPIELYGKSAEFKGAMYMLPDEFEEKLYACIMDEELYENLLTTPGFASDKKGNCFTTAAERKFFLEKIEGSNCCCRLFTYNTLQVVFVSQNIGKDDKFETVIEKIKNSGKLNILYQAQVHGTEPASGEGALVFLKHLTENGYDNVLENINLMIVPCCNPLGSELFERENDGIDMNRDALSLECSESVYLHQLFYMVMPEVVIDAHSFTRANGIKTTKISRSLLDIRISPVGSYNVCSDIKTLSGEITDRALERLSDYGFRTGYYGDSVDPTTSRVFYGLHGTCSFLVECEGTRSGRMHFKRNVISSFLAVKTLIKIISMDSDCILDIVNAARADIINKKDDFILKHEKSKKRYLKVKQPAFDFEGNIVDPDFEIKFSQYDEIVNKRKKPDAYILPIDMKEINDILEIFDKHQIKYFIHEQFTEIKVSQYYRDSFGKICVSDDKVRQFENGVVIISLNQIRGNIICSLIEPDEDDSKNMRGSLVQRDILKFDNSKYGVFRFAGDYNMILSEKRSI